MSPGCGQYVLERVRQNWLLNRVVMTSVLLCGGIPGQPLVALSRDLLVYCTISISVSFGLIALGLLQKHLDFLEKMFAYIDRSVQR